MNHFSLNKQDINKKNEIINLIKINDKYKGKA